VLKGDPVEGGWKVSCAARERSTSARSAPRSAAAGTASRPASASWDVLERVLARLREDLRVRRTCAGERAGRPARRRQARGLDLARRRRAGSPVSPGPRKVGHAGTLDPMATGVLVLGIGRATRLLGHLALTDKAYDATVRLGATTVTDDAEGELVEQRDASGVTDAALTSAMAALTGELLQVPSSVSAVKVDGVRSYARVRAGEAVELAARRVTVSRFELQRRQGTTST
jgi:tRNA U55 pseudouridine synthase TruB